TTDNIPANWVLEADNTIATQVVNADPSILLSDCDVQNERIQGMWRVDTTVDDDFMGFVFGYQDSSHFYLFDWKLADQDDPTFGFAERGMSVKLVDADGPLIGQDLWQSNLEAGPVRSLFHN